MNFSTGIVIALVTVASLTATAYSQDITTQPTRPDSDKIILNFQNTSISEILDYLSETAGLVIMSDTSIAGRMNIVSKQPLNIDQAISLINSVIKENGYAAIRTENILKLVKISDAKHLNIPVTSGNDPEKITPGDELIIHIIPIRYAIATKLKDDISSLVPPYAVLASNEASNSLIITDTKSNVKRLVEIVQALDTNMAAKADVKVFNLVYANANNTASLINEVFDQQQNQTSRNAPVNPFAFMRRGGPRPGGDNATDDSGSTANIKVIAAADSNTNTVVVSGPIDTLAVISNVIRELDANPSDERTIFVYPLKNAQASDLKETMNNLFQQMQNLTQNTTRGTTVVAAAPRRQQADTGGSASSSNDLSDDVYIESDNSTNSLLVMTSPKNYDKVKRVIDELDKPVPQVLIKVLIAEVTVNDSLDLGTEFSVLNIRNSGGQSLFRTNLLSASTTGGMINILEGDLNWTLKALAKVGKLNVLSRPYILTSNNETAKITVGERVPFITDTRTTETGQTINTIQYEDIGIILEVTPSINPEGLVIMTVKPEISTTTAETIPISETVNAAVFAKRSSESKVSIQNNQTIVIGGLMQDTETESVSKIPLLGDIPLLGELFKRTIKEKGKTELLIFLTPLVATDTGDLDKITELEKSHSRIMNNLDQNQSLKEQLENMELKID